MEAVLQEFDNKYFITYHEEYLMKSYSSNEVIRILKRNGWIEVACVGDHHQFKHPVFHGRITVPHPKKDLPIGTVKSILSFAGIKKEEK